MLNAPPQHHYRTRRASAIESLKESHKAAEHHTSPSTSDSCAYSPSSSPVSSASTVSTSRDIHQDESKGSQSDCQPDQLAGDSPGQQRLPGMATMTDGHPRHYPHLQLPKLLSHGQQQPHSPHLHYHRHQHPRDAFQPTHQGGARSEHGESPGSPALLIDRPASAAPQVGYFERSSGRPAAASHDTKQLRSITSAPPGAAIHRGVTLHDAPRTPASPGHMSTTSTGSRASGKRGRSTDISEERQAGAPSMGGGLAAYGQEPRGQRNEAGRAFGHQEMNLYASADRITPTTQSDNRGPPSISSTGSMDLAVSVAPYDSVNAAPHSNSVSNAPNGSGGDPGGREMCLCPKIRKVPRPRNAFILYRQHHQASVAANNPGLANPEISKLIGEQWREQPDDVKESWKRLAEEEKVRHQQLYPDYRYQPRRGGKSGAAHSGGARPISSGGDDPGRCNRCGGKLIATPRTPSTPFTVVAAGDASSLSAAPASAGSGSSSSAYAYFPPGAHGPESEHLRRGSISSVGSGDSHARRHNGQGQYPLANISEGYVFHHQHQRSSSDMTLPDTKRRRYNTNSSTYPMSPPAAGNYTHIDPRYQQHQEWQLGSQSIGSATPYSSAQIPRGEMASQEPHAASYGQHPPYHQSRQATARMPQHRPSSMPQVQGSTLPQQHQHMSQLQTQFDESLRLPPLQPKGPPPSSTPADAKLVHESSTMGRHYQQGQQLEAMDASRLSSQRGQAQRQEDPRSWPPAMHQGQSPTRSRRLHHTQDYFEQRPHHGQTRSLEQEMGMSRDAPKWPFLLKTEILRAIQPPLSTEQSRSSETRGPVIAVEGADAAAIREISRVIESALLVSQDCAVKVWSDDSLTSVDAGPGGGMQPTISKYLNKMVRWHETSNELVNFVTHHPPRQAGSGQMTASSCVDPTKMPVAIVSTGYSLTVSDRWAAALQQPGLSDPYNADDHWRWMATLWRGIVGADLTVYIHEQNRAGSDVDGSSYSGVELLTASAVSANNSPDAAGTAGTRSVHGGEDACIMVVTVEKGRGMDEKLERRLGFEIMEWVRGGGFSAAATLRQLSSTA